MTCSVIMLYNSSKIICNHQMVLGNFNPIIRVYHPFNLILLQEEQILLNKLSIFKIYIKCIKITMPQLMISMLLLIIWLFQEQPIIICIHNHLQPIKCFNHQWVSHQTHLEGHNHNSHNLHNKILDSNPCLREIWVAWGCKEEWEVEWEEEWAWVKCKIIKWVEWEI